MTIDVEVFRRGDPFSKVATHSATVPPRNPYMTNPDSQYCADVVVALTGLTPEQSYDFAFRLSDEFGAVISRVRPTGGTTTNIGDSTRVLARESAPVSRPDL